MKNAEIRLIAADELPGLPSREDEWAEVARRFVTNLAARGTLHYVENIDVEMALLQVREQLLPLAISRGPGRSVLGGRQSDVVRPSVHYVDYHRDAQARAHPDTPAWWFGVRSLPMTLAARLGAMDRVVIVNQWLLTTNPPATYRAGDPERLAEVLSAAFPDHAIIVRGLLPERDSEPFGYFVRAGFRAIPFRRVWIVDDCAEALRTKKDAKQDQRLLERSDYEVRSDPDLLDGLAERLADLYRQLYMDKHSRHNVCFKPEFMRLAQRCGLWRLATLEKEGRVDGFMGWFVKDGRFTGSVVGYDLSLPRELGLYRQVMIYQTGLAASLGLPLHISSGVGDFKAHRGARPYREYEAVWDRHLSPRRRLPWALLDYFIHRNTPRLPSPS